jgi:hypothetical protein
MNIDWWIATLWIFGASLLGFLISFVFAGRMKFSRNLFLVFYIIMAGFFLAAFFQSTGIDIATTISNNWLWGVLFGLLSSVFLVRHVLSQPATRQHEGMMLAFDIGWTGLIYGLMDALLLNVLPVLAIQAGFAGFNWATTLIGKIGLGALAMLGSLLITLTYHLGYPEFRNKKIVKVLVGNSIMTLAVLLAGNPFGALLSHPAMHVAAVLRGPETTIQLPPHYYPPLTKLRRHS